MIPWAFDQPGETGHVLGGGRYVHSTTDGVLALLIHRRC